jgi:nitrile hydratase beta subunit
MNGIHDMGGMHGMGPIDPEPREPVFHEPWEARMFGLRRATTSPPGLNIDRSRHLRETMPPVAYLSWSYYDHWYFNLATALLQTGLVTMDELRTGRGGSPGAKRNDAMQASQVERAIATSGNFARPLSEAPRFAVGAAITTRNINPAGHTRLPRYARGKRGLVHRRHGGHVFPDTNARGEGECPQHLYTVAFTARELWGSEASSKDKVYLDLWESYLEPA